MSWRRTIRKTLAALALVCWLPLSAWAQPTLEAQQAVYWLEDTSIELTGVQSGDLLVAWIGDKPGWFPDPSVSDTVNGAWTMVECGGFEPGTDGYAALFYRANSASGSLTVTLADTSGYLADPAWGVMRWSGMATEDVFDGCGDNWEEDATTSHPHGSLTSTAAGIFITALGSQGAPPMTVAAGFTFTAFPPDSDETSGWLQGHGQYRITVGPESSVTATITSANAAPSAGVIAAFKAASGGPEPTCNTGGLLLMGVGRRCGY